MKKQVSRDGLIRTTVNELLRQGATDLQVVDSAVFSPPSLIKGVSPDICCRIGELNIIVVVETESSLNTSAARHRWATLIAVAQRNNGLFVPAVEPGLSGKANDLHRELTRFSVLTLPPQRP
ncbi:MAG: hypothetical protein SFU56_09085 [Capsulimonadales bacterium]|nr:hypothetical protein [Capsulimonadales bacterium]